MASQTINVTSDGADFLNNEDHWEPVMSSSQGTSSSDMEEVIDINSPDPEQGVRRNLSLKTVIVSYPPTPGGSFVEPTSAPRSSSPTPEGSEQAHPRLCEPSQDGDHNLPPDSTGTPPTDLLPPRLGPPPTRTKSEVHPPTPHERGSSFNHPLPDPDYAMRVRGRPPSRTRSDGGTALGFIPHRAWVAPPFGVPLVEIEEGNEEVSASQQALVNDAFNESPAVMEWINGALYESDTSPA
ncbi:hypothetical protein AURDEDRAFT_120118 [Auricularia subglabra TFB-10046 SS5]|nr:hypothetical protein AURDEDRAFT_120118 [Auricularia subglabra TFB-10046 SS5]